MSDQKSVSSARRWLLPAAGLLILVAAAVWGVNYLLVGQYFVSTDDAYITADSSLIAAKVGGYVREVDVLQGQRVKKGDVLAVIDSRDYENALAAAQAEVDNDTAALKLQQDKIAAARATLSGDAAREAYDAGNAARYAHLAATGGAAQQEADQSSTDLATIRDQMDADTANLHAALAQVDVLTAGLAQAKANAAQAALNLGYTTITAPFAGVVGNKTVAVGDYLQPGTEIMAVVPLSEVYVVANYKETQLTSIRPGQKVSVSVDAFPNLNVTGKVDTIYPASGETFALLPPDNATGNFTKIVQRIPVKIVLDLTPDEIGKLRPGMSVEPEIDTRNVP